MGLLFTTALRVPLSHPVFGSPLFLDGLCMSHNRLSYAAVTNNPQNVNGLP